MASHRLFHLLYLLYLLYLQIRITVLIYIYIRLKKVVIAFANVA